MVSMALLQSKLDPNTSKKGLKGNLPHGGSAESIDDEYTSHPVSHSTPRLDSKKGGRGKVFRCECRLLKS